LPARTASATLGLIAYSTVSLNFRFALPNKFFEYLMAGVPVLSSALPEVANLIEKYRVGHIVDPCTPERIAEAINDLLGNPALIADLRENALEAARSLHWGEEEKKLLGLYQDLAVASTSAGDR